MMTCTAKELCAATGGTLVQDGEGFSCVSTDSRRVEQGCLFIPLVGERFDGHTYLTQALESGAAGCLCSRLPEALVPGRPAASGSSSQLPAEDSAECLHPRAG